MSRSSLSAIGKRFIGLTAGMNAIASAWYFLIMILVTGDVVGRALFNAPITGTPEIVKISMVGMFFIQLPNAVWMNRVIRSDFVLARLKPGTLKVVDLPLDLIGLFFCIILVSSLYPDMINAWRTLDYEGEGSFRCPAYPVFTLIVTGAGFSGILLAIRFIQRLVALLARRERGA